MSGMREDSPALIALCEKCTEADCSGSCEKYNRMLAAEAAKAPYKGKVYTNDGFTGNLREWSERLGVPESTLRMRLWRGWPVEKVLNKHLREYVGTMGRRGRTYQWNGGTYTVKQLAEMRGVELSRMYSWLENYGVNTAMRLDPNTHSKGQKYELDGQMYTAKELAALRGTTHCNMLMRLKRMSVHEAVYGPRTTVGRKKKHE